MHIKLPFNQYHSNCYKKQVYPCFIADSEVLENITHLVYSLKRVLFYLPELAIKDSTPLATSTSYLDFERRCGVLNFNILFNQFLSNYI